jgi:hypothetical protein
VTSLVRIVDVVRTTLVELVAEMRAGTPQDATPTKAVTDQSVSVARAPSQTGGGFDQRGSDGFRTRHPRRFG